ncbi:MAG: thiamine phosphate synthase [Candidatus Sumerlaeaceae bacterium]
MSRSPNCAWGLYVILDSKLSGLGHLEAATRALAGGAKVIQLRDKGARFEDLLQVGHVLRKLTREAGATLLVNDNPYLAKEIEADGVHLGQEDFPPYIARETLGPGAIIGISTHTKQQALLASTQPVSYIAVGPVFPTQSKQSSNSPVGLEHIKWVRKHVSQPIVAIGGITSAAIPDVIRAGADNIAVIREVMASGEIEAKVRELSELIDNAKAVR